jgi:hypothetical protein
VTSPGRNRFTGSTDTQQTEEIQARHAHASHGFASTQKIGRSSGLCMTRIAPVACTTESNRRREKMPDDGQHAGVGMGADLDSSQIQHLDVQYTT